MRKLLITFSLIATGCGFSPNCKHPSLKELSYPIQMLINNDLMFILSSDENLEFCSAYITVYDISEGYPVPISTISPISDSITFPGRMLISRYGIVITEKGGERVILMDGDGRIKDYEREGGNPQGLILLKRNDTGDENDIIGVLNLTKGTGSFYSINEEGLGKVAEVSLSPFNYTNRIFPVSLTFVSETKELWIGFTASSKISVIDVDAGSTFYLSEKEVFSIAPNGDMGEVRNLIASEGGVYATIENPDAIIFIRGKEPEILSMLPYHVGVLKIIKSKNLMVISSLSRNWVAGISLLNFKTIWEKDTDDRIVDIGFNERMGFLYGIGLKRGKLFVLNPDTGEEL